MTAYLKPLGMLKSYTSDLSIIEIEAGISVREALQRSNIPTELVALVMVNDIPRDKNYMINDEDFVQVMAVIGGG
jgi:sulfur carrier protein ThiS